MAHMQLQEKGLQSCRRLPWKSLLPVSFQTHSPDLALRICEKNARLSGVVLREKTW